MPNAENKFTKLQNVLFDDKGKKWPASWCNVDIYNKFTFDKEYHIDSSVDSYKVENMPVEEKDGMNYWTNEAEMETILCVIVDGEIHFYDENIDRIDTKYIHSNTV